MFYGKPNSKRFQQPIVGLRRSLEVLMAHRKSSKPNISLVATVPKVWFGKHSRSLLRAALRAHFLCRRCADGVAVQPRLTPRLFCREFIRGLLSAQRRKALSDRRRVS